MGYLLFGPSPNAARGKREDDEKEEEEEDEEANFEKMLSELYEINFKLSRSNILNIKLERSPKSSLRQAFLCLHVDRLIAIVRTTRAQHFCLKDDERGRERDRENRSH